MPRQPPPTLRRPARHLLGPRIPELVAAFLVSARLALTKVGPALIS